MEVRFLHEFYRHLTRLTHPKKTMWTLAMLMLFGFYSFGQSPVIAVRFNNPVYDCKLQTYKVDVEFNASEPGLKIFDMNVRFFYETSVLQYVSTGNFSKWYIDRKAPMPYISTEDGTNFGITGNVNYWNGSVYLVNPLGDDFSTGTGIVTISSDPLIWTQLFSLTFKVLNPSAFTQAGICPALIWDLEADPLKGGFGDQSDGVVITYLAPGTTSGYLSATENVAQCNWAYDGDPITVPYGSKVQTNCIAGDAVSPVIATTATSHDLGCNPTIVAPLFSATDNCDPSVTPVVSTAGPTNTGCAYSQTWTANCSDVSGNAASPVSITYTWTTDTEKPVIATTATTQYIGCNPTVVAPVFTVTDNCSTGLVANVTSGGTSNTGCLFSQTWTANATDGCGNVATPVSITYTWTQDRVLPVIAALDQSKNLGCNPIVLAPAFSATDNCEGVVTPVITTAGPSHSGCVFTQTWTASYTDGCENVALPVSVTYTWTNDTELPVIVAVDSNRDLGCNPTVVAPAFTASDNCMGVVTPNVTTAGPTHNGCAYSQTWTANFTDGCNNAALPVSTTYTWTIDITAPALTGYPTTPVNLGINPVPPVCSDAMALVTATDGCGGVSTKTCTPGNISSNGCQRTQSFTVYATDGCQNSAYCTVTFTWTVDTGTPEFVNCPSAPIQLGCNPTPPDCLDALAQVTAVDGCSGPILPVCTPGLISENGCGRSQTFTMVATNNTGKSATCTITFNWKVDTTLPVVSTTAVSGSLGCNPVVVAPVFAASDNCDGTLTPVVTTPGAVNTSGCMWSQTWTANATDACGNKAVAKVITYTWKVDLTIPVITTTAVSRDLGCNPASIPVPVFIATDNCEGTVVPVVSTSGPVPDGCLWSQTWTATYTDGCQNAALPVSITYTWKLDVTPPDFVTPPDITLQAGSDHRYDASPAITGVPTGLSDNCLGVPAVSNTDVLAPGQVLGTLLITRRWTATDNCGNKTTKPQLITVIGGCLPPVLNLSNICIYLNNNGKWTLNRNDVSNMTLNMAQAEDYKDLIISVTPNSFDCNDTQSPVPVVVTVSNTCGITVTGTAEVTVADTIKPVALCRDIKIYLDKFDQAYIVATDINRSNDKASVPAWGKTFRFVEGGSYDNCGIEEMKISKELFTSANVGMNDVLLVVYDHSRNSDVCHSTVTVIDTISSVLEPVNPIVMTVEPGVCKTKITYPEIKYSGAAPAKIELEAGLGANGEFPLGTTVERWKATDLAGKLSYTSFSVTVKTYNATPVMSPVADITVNEDGAAFDILLSGIGYGNDCLAQQIVSLVTSNSNPEILTVAQEYVNGAATGKLHVTLVPDKSGEATITLTLKDNGGKENGGNDTMVKTFKITVKEVNDLPTVNPIADQYITLPGALSVNIATAFHDADAGDVLTYTVTKSDGTALPAWMSFSPATGLMTGTPSTATLGVTEVKVIATDKAGATVQDIFLVVVVSPDLATLNVSASKGTVQLTGGYNVQLLVKEGALYNMVVNTPVFVAGTWTFFNLPLGTYLARATVTDAVMNPGLMNTWYESAASVTGASPVLISSAAVKTIQVKMLSSGLAMGDGKISGVVVKKTGTPDLIAQGKDPVSSPAAGVDMVLRQNGAVVASTVTGPDGKYAFTGIPVAEYEVWTEIPGLTQNYNQKVTLTTAIPEKNKVDFTIWSSNGNRVITEVLEVNNLFHVVLYPNPTAGAVNIDLTWGELRKVDVTVYNILGVEVLRKQFNTGEQIRFDLDGNASGVYMVKLQGEGRTMVRKVTLDRR